MVLRAQSAAVLIIEGVDEIRRGFEVVQGVTFVII